MTWKRYDKGHIEKLKYYSVPSLPCSLLIRSAIRPARAPEPHGSVCRTEVLPTVEMTGSGTRRVNRTLQSLKGQDGMHPRVLRKLANVTVIQVSSLEGHSNQVKYLM